jgi:hypothetical protein
VPKEPEKLHKKQTFAPLNVSDLTAEQKKSSLESLVFLKENRDGSKKGLARAGGRKQREVSSKANTTSPTISLESVLTTATIDAFKHRDVDIVSVPGAYLTIDMDKEVFVCLRRRLIELMVKTAPEIYRKYISMGSDNKQCVYVKLRNALYGCLQSAVLVYLKLLADLEANHFVLNPYDPCVANKVVNGKQFTIIWHMDDLKLLHVDKHKNEVTNTIYWLKSINGEYMRMSRGKKHVSWGWKLITPSQVK